MSCCGVPLAPNTEAFPKFWICRIVLELGLTLSSDQQTLVPTGKFVSAEGPRDAEVARAAIGGVEEDREHAVGAPAGRLPVLKRIRIDPDLDECGAG